MERPNNRKLMKLKSILFFLAALAVTSCGTARYYGGASARSIGTMAAFRPCSYISYIDRSGKQQYDDSLSTVSAQLVAMASEDAALPVSEWLPLDEAGQQEVVSFMDALAGASPKLVGVMPVPSVLDSLLEEAGYRYGLILFADGMVRDTRNLVREAVKEAAIGVALAVLTGAVVVSVPDRCVSALRAVILDAEQNRIVYDHAVVREDEDPLDLQDTRRLVRKVMKDFVGRGLP